MKPQQRILTGIQSSGKPHLGNALGAILPALELASRENARAFFFVADLHSLTSLPDAAERRENTLGVAAAWIAFGLDTSAHNLYRQSMIPEVCELTWYLSCFTPYSLLEKSHSFKDKADNLESVNTGLFTYPVLMAADILLYDANSIPVGKDQKQHVEICRDIARLFNNQYGEVFVIPEPLIREDVMTIPGIDGRKMSKSYGNFIDIFATPKDIEKQVMRIVTDSTPVEAPKNPDSCNVFKLFSLLGTEQQVAEMRQKYIGGGYGYGQAKKDLLKLLVEKFDGPRQRFFELMARRSELEDILRAGEVRVREIARKKLEVVRNCLGF
jgi:tryptophanyl-tRNA synthetase